MHNTIALFASSRRNGNTGQLMDRIAAELEIAVVDLAEKNMSPYDSQVARNGGRLKRLSYDLCRASFGGLTGMAI
jgi:hypothetical protein